MGLNDLNLFGRLKSSYGVTHPGVLINLSAVQGVLIRRSAHEVAVRLGRTSVDVVVESGSLHFL
jgi:hypothetical protein